MQPGGFNEDGIIKKIDETLLSVLQERTELFRENPEEALRTLSNLQSVILEKDGFVQVDDFYVIENQAVILTPLRNEETGEAEQMMLLPVLASGALTGYQLEFNLDNPDLTPDQRATLEEISKTVLISGDGRIVIKDWIGDTGAENATDFEAPAGDEVTDSSLPTGDEVTDSSLPTGDEAEDEEDADGDANGTGDGTTGGGSKGTATGNNGAGSGSNGGGGGSCGSNCGTGGGSGGSGGSGGGGTPPPPRPTTPPPPPPPRPTTTTTTTTAPPPPPPPPEVCIPPEIPAPTGGCKDPQPTTTTTAPAGY
jgi:hypothetical protein